MNFLQTLQTREKIMVIGAAVAIVLALLYTLVIDPVLERSGRLDRQIQKAQQDLKSLQAHRIDYLQQQRVLDGINTQLKQQQGASIFSQLEQIAKKTGIPQKNIRGMKPLSSTPSDAYAEESVEVRMEEVTLDQLRQYLFEVERSPQYLKVKRLLVKPRLNNRQSLTATFRVSSFTPKDNAG